MDHVSYGGSRPIHRPHRSILDQVSTNTQPSISRDLVEYRAIAHLTMLMPGAHAVGQRIDHDTVGGISVNHRLYISQLSVKSWSIIVQLSVIYWLTVGMVSVDT